MGQYSIKEVEVLSGVKAHTLRIWEQRYNFLRPSRTDTNIRFYNDDQLRLLLNVGTLNRNGMKISRIAALGEEQLKKEVLGIFENSKEPDDLLDSLIHSMIDFDEKRFEKTLNSAILKLGFEKTFSLLVFPFMNRTGILWVAGSVRVAQEHFISNLIRRKIMVAIDNQYVQVNKGSRKFILFLPEGETHELLLLFAEYILRHHHHETAYMGASLPLQELEFIAKQYRPDYLVTFITVPLVNDALKGYLARLEKVYPQAKILIGGTQIGHMDFRLSKNYIQVNSAGELISSIQ